MVDDQKAYDRPVQRMSECHRFQEQLWSLAYHELWPVKRQRTKASGAKTKRHGSDPSRVVFPIARRA